MHSGPMHKHRPNLSSYHTDRAHNSCNQTGSTDHQHQHQHHRHQQHNSAEQAGASSCHHHHCIMGKKRERGSRRHRKTLHNTRIHTTIVYKIYIQRSGDHFELLATPPQQRRLDCTLLPPELRDWPACQPLPGICPTASQRIDL